MSVLECMPTISVLRLCVSLPLPLLDSWEFFHLPKCKKKQRKHCKKEGEIELKGRGKRDKGVRETQTDNCSEGVERSPVFRPSTQKSSSNKPGIKKKQNKKGAEGTR